MKILQSVKVQIGIQKNNLFVVEYQSILMPFWVLKNMLILTKYILYLVIFELSKKSYFCNKIASIGTILD